MYNFVTTTLINSLKDAKGVDIIATAAQSGTTPGYMKIRRVRDFFKGKAGENVLSIYKAVGTDKRLAEADANLSAYFTAAASTSNGLIGHYRLKLYVGLEGSENPYYANDLVFKGKPFFVEFMVKAGDTADTIAAKIKKNADKYIAMVYEDALLDLTVYESGKSNKTPNETTASTGHLYITGTDEHQRINLVDIQKLTKDDENENENYFDTVLSLYQVKDYNFDTAADVTRTLDDAVGTSIEVTQGRVGFGTYHHLMKDYRLPTAANTRWIAIQKDETPILGNIYNQYTITYCTERGNMGTSVVGEPTKSVTTHVFWVNASVSGVVAAFEAALANIGWVSNGTTGGDTNENGVIDDDETAA